MKIANSFYKKFSIPKCLVLNFIPNQYKLYIQGPLGQSSISLFSYKDVVKLMVKDHELILYKKTKRSTKKRLDSFSLLLEKTLQGSVNGHLFYLNLVGIGYKAWCTSLKALKDESSDQSNFFFLNGSLVNDNSVFLCLKVGYSHQISILVPESVFVFCSKSSMICVYGQDFQQLTRFVAFVRQIRLPESYKGKGIRLRDEIIVLKPGKKK